MIPVLYFLSGVVVGSTVSFLSMTGCLNIITFDNNNENSDILPTMCDVITQTNTIINKEVSTLTTKCIKEYKDEDDNSSATTEACVSDDDESNETASFYSMFLSSKRKIPLGKEVHVHFKN